MSAKSKVPQIRFSGFCGEWNSKKLDNIATFFSGGTPTSTNKSYYNGTIPFIGSGKISSSSVEQFITYEALENSSAKMVNKGDLLYALYGATSGEVAISKINGAINQAVLCLRTQEDKYFLFKWFLLNKKRILSTYLQGGQGNLSAQIIKDLNVHFPKQDEQIKIGNYFKQLDILIEQKEKKYQKLKQLKKAMLNKMFPKNGADIPQIRFKGFSRKWEEKELEDIVNRYDNLRIPVSAVDRILGNTPYYGANGIQGYVEGYTHAGEFILVAEDGANDLKNYPVQYVNGKIWVNNHAHVLQAKESLADNSFLKFAILKINIEPFLVGGSRAKLNANVMMKINILLPKIDEQIKIGNYFQKLDKLIELQKKELEKLKNIKKASLDKMFV